MLKTLLIYYYVVVASALAATSLARADESGRHEGVGEAQAVPSYCGVYALYRGARLLGVKAHFSELLSPKYISSPRDGSTAEDLLEAASHLGLRTRFYQRLSCTSLYYIESPMLLHTKNTLSASTFNHWVLFLGIRENNACIIDGTTNHRFVPLAELAPLWDGHAIVLEQDPTEYPRILLLYSGTYSWCVAGMIAMTLGVGRCSDIGGSGTRGLGGNLRRDIGKQLVGISTISTISWALVYLYSPAGFLASTNAISAIKDAELGSFLPTVDLTYVQRIMLDRAITIVDARGPADYAAAHIPGSINIRPGATEKECKEIMSGVPAGQLIVIYCQSSGCPYSVVAARVLKRCGYKRLYLFPGGWLEWTRANSE